MPASPDTVAEPLAVRGMRIGEDVEPLVTDVGRRCSNPKRLLVWIDRLVV
jgi:hypothetical protein